MTESVTVIFVTHNRKDLLFQAVKAVLAQTMPVQVIIMDDASEDDTDKMVAKEFPGAVYHRSEFSRGPSFQRNQGARLAQNEILVFLDDDTVLQSADTLETTNREFNDASIGAVTIPFINVLQNGKVMLSAPDQQHAYLVHAFIAAAFAIKRKLFLDLGGFREEYFYMGEEGDLCVRLLNEGYFVKAGRATPAHHHQPAGRISYAADFYGRRNDIYFLYLNSPRSLLFSSLAGTIIKGIWWGIKVGRIRNMLKGLLAGIKFSFFRPRQLSHMPVKKTVYLRYRYLKKHEPIEMTRFTAHSSF